MGLYVYSLYVVTNGSEGLIGQDFPRLGKERGFIQLYLAISPIFLAPIVSFNQLNDFRYRL
jgi:hypothetical protein